MLRGEQGSGPKGVDDLCFHTYDGVLPKATFVFQWGLKSKIKNE